MKSMCKSLNWLVCSTAHTHTDVRSALSTAATVLLLSLASLQAAPWIDTDPQDQTVAVGGNCTFTVTSTNTDATYQWYFGGNTLSGATTSRYAITGARLSDAGNYSVVLTNDTGSVTSQVATLTVLTPPSISTQPVSSTIQATNTALTLWVIAAGNNLSYQWYKGNNALNGKTQTNLVFTSLAAGDAGTYTVKVTNAVGKVTSANAVVIPVSKPIITTQPVGKGLAVGSNYTLSVTATALYPHYFWWLNATNQVAIDTTNSFKITGANPTNDGNYTVVITNLAGSVTSSIAPITVEVLPTITTQPAGLSIQVTNTPLTLSVTATGDNLIYQWYKRLYS